MNDSNTSIETLFEREKPRLVGLAYRLLGTIGDAEDVVQEAFLRYQRLDPTALPDSPAAWLTTVTTRLAIDHLRALQKRRAHYHGPWLPEPWVTPLESDPAELLVLAETLSLALLVVLERLSPLERAVFLLREVFGHDYAAIAEIVGESVEHCRQLFHRAKSRIAEGPVRRRPPVEEHERLTHAFMAACATGDPAQLSQLLADDIVATSDGGGRVAAAARPISGRDAVVRYVLGATKKGAGPAGARLAMVNGQLGIVLYDAQGMANNVVQLEVESGRIHAIRTVRNPEKLRRIALLENKVSD